MARDNIRRDMAGVGPDPRMAGRLTRMSSIHGYRIADGEPDIRGWEVRTLAGADVGEVDDLLVDPHRGEVVMLDIDLNDSDQHVNIPIRGVQIDRGRHCVIVDSGDVRSARESLVGASKLGEAGSVLRSDARSADVRESDEDRDREIRYGASGSLGATRDIENGNVEEHVVERRPVIEEVVVRRRVVNDGDAETD